MDIDETSSNKDKFFQRFGWAPKSKCAFRNQIFIDGRLYTAMVAYTTPCSALLHGRYPGPVAHNQCVDFIESVVAPKVANQSVAIIDKSSF